MRYNERMHEIYFIRHGESEANAANLVAGQTDPSLTPKGVQQAETAGEFAKTQQLKFDLIVSSPLIRARNTASIIAKYVGYPEANIQLKDELKERNCGDFEGGPTESYYSTPETVSVNEYGVESLEHLYERASNFIDWLKKEYADKRVLIVSHTGIGKMLRIVLEGRDAEEMDKTVIIPNATIMRLV